MSGPDRKSSDQRPDPSAPRNRPDRDPPDLTAPTSATPEELRRLNRALSTRSVQLVADLRAATAARDTVERQRTQISRTLLLQTHELRELERLYKNQGEELQRLRSEVSGLRSASSDARGDHAQQIAVLQSQITQQTADIQDLGRRVARLTQERDRLRDNNDHIASEVELACAEIHNLHEEQRFLDRQIDHAQDARGLVESVTIRAQEALYHAEDALHERDQAARAASAPDQLVQERDRLIQERDRAQAASTEADHRLGITRDELHGIRRLLRQTQSDLNTARSTQAAATADLINTVEDRDNVILNADRARSELEDLRTFLRLGLKLLDRELTHICRAGTSLDTAERTVGLLESQIHQIREQHERLQLDHDTLQQNRNVLRLEHDVALQRLAIVVTAVGARPLPSDELGDPAALLRTLRELPQTRGDHQSAGEVPDQPALVHLPAEAAKRPDQEEKRPKRSGDIADPESSKRGRRDSAAGNRDSARPSERLLRSVPNKGAKSSDVEMAKDQPVSEPAHHPGQDDLAEEGKIDDDGGFVDDDGDEPGENHGNQAAEDADDEKEEEEGEDTSGTGGTNNDEEEDKETAQITNELLEAQTLQAMAQSRSAERRRQHASPRRGPVIGASGGPLDDDPDDDEAAGANPDPDPRGPNPAPANRRRPARNPLAPVARFGPEAQCIPGRAQPRILIQADVDHWISDELDNKTLAAMLIQALFPVMPNQLGWIFPYFELAEDRPQVVDTDFCWELITENNVRTLLATRPWEVLENSDGAISFETDVGGHLGLAIRQYQSYEKANCQAYWESTHSFPILPASAKAHPWLTVYHKERNNRRSHAGNRWKGFLQVLIVAMQKGWCDLDILLDTFFLHGPHRHESVIWYPGYESRQANIKNCRLNRPEPTDLLEALDECNGADSWRNHYRDSPQDHPARQIARLTDKFFGVNTADAE